MCACLYEFLQRSHTYQCVFERLLLSQNVVIHTTLMSNHKYSVAVDNTISSLIMIHPVLKGTMHFYYRLLTA